MVLPLILWHLGEGPEIEPGDLTLIAGEPFANNSLRALIYADHRHLWATRFELDNISNFEVVSHEHQSLPHHLFTRKAIQIPFAEPEPAIVR
jgi:hypothetical protein